MPDPKLTLVDSILSDNTPQSDESIDFNMSSAEDGTKGLYYTSTNTENNKTTYYFRGAVENNYVSFAGFYWRIVRINEDGSIRVIHAYPEIGSSKFNSGSNNDNAYVGYMYGTPSSSTYSATHANINDSTIKGVIDTWYENNLINYSLYLADAGFCGDRSIYNGLGYGANTTYYGPYNRLIDNKIPQFSCPQSNDLYTTSSSNKGNKALDYPIGLITADEVAYAGGVFDSDNMDSYLNTPDSFWTMSPLDFWDFAEEFVIAYGGLFSYDASEDLWVHPVINLKSTVEITSGDGTSSNPYVIKTN